MTSVQQEFQDRVQEIEAYLGLIAGLDEGRTALVQKESGAAAYSSQAQDDLVRTSKASALLLLYNLMESTASNAVEAIYDEMANRDVAFDACRREVRLVVLANLKRHAPAKILPDLTQLTTDIISKAFQKDKLVSGNVDAEEIRGIADTYGFRHPAADGRDLLTVKSHRNDLAHGVKSFAEVGRTFSMQDVVRLKDQVITYLTALLESVAHYIAQQHYLSAPGRP